MKRLSGLTAVLLVTNFLTLTVLFWGCGSTPCPPTPCAGNCYSLVCTPSPQFNARIAYQMVSNYRMNHWKIINNYCEPFKSSDAMATTSPDDPSVVNDARSAWFNLDTLKQFINTIESLTCIKDTSCDHPLKLGIRIYYAEYPLSADSLHINYGITDGQYAGMHTLLMIPTYDNGLHDVDFDPYSFYGSNCSFKSVFDLLTPICALPPTTSVNARNHGGLIPPPYRFTDDWNNSGATFMKFVDFVNDNVDPLASLQGPNRKPY